MADNIGEYVLQWEGHAGHVTQRFSGLFARQSLVDVTLICEEQRLRVHKLVLAACSLYFEEMLEQDLGQEPTILLSDLNFEVLKAMVEFMYCGETSVSEQHLEPLLHAARVFKVKELACIAENMMRPQIGAGDQVRNCTEFQQEEEGADDLEDENDYSLFSDNDCVQTSSWSKNGTDAYSGNELEESSDTNIEYLEDFHRSKSPLSLAEIARRNLVKFYKEIPNFVHIYEEKTNCDNKGMDDVNVFSNENNQPQPVLYEQCCDFVNTDRNLSEKSSPEFAEVNRTVDKCLKVYTHKRLKSVEGGDKQFVKIIDELPEPHISDKSIDLIEEPSKNETELERDYILSLSNENAEILIDFDSSEASEDNAYYADSDMNFDKEDGKVKDIFSNENGILSKEESDTTSFKTNSLSVPVLRRSVRLSHQENEDSTNNNNNFIQEEDEAREFRKESFKRKNKESDLYRELDENKVLQGSMKKCSNTTRSLRSDSRKLIRRRRSKARLSLSKSNDIEEEKSRRNNKTSNSDSCEPFSNKFNTIATVSRALWGDMSDCLENSENDIDFSDYSPSKEIPFAVGLLPLRDALERMQATPDYQPRKTRSSVTPFRQEFKGVKRKNLSNINMMDSNSNNFKVKRQSSNSHGNNLPRNTVCHVRITTSHSDGVKPRRRLINEQVDAPAMSPANIVNRQ